MRNAFGGSTMAVPDKGSTIVITRDFTEVVQEIARRDSAVREELLNEALERLESGDTEVGITLLQDYISATIGFIAESQNRGNMDLRILLLHDSINAIVGFDEYDRFANGEVWQGMNCGISEGANAVVA